MEKVMGYQFPDETIKTYDHHLAYILSCFLGSLVSMKQAVVLGPSGKELRVASGQQLA